jgi:hypothetical protein
MEKSDLADFRLRFALQMIARMTVRTSLISAVASGISTLEESREDLKRWLESNAALADVTYAEALGDEAEVYAGEVREVIDELVSTTDSVANDLSRALP